MKTNVPLGPTEEQWRSDRHLWLTADGKRVVEDGDPDAAILYATEGTLVPLSDAQRYKLAPKKRARREPEEAPEPKMDPPSEDKMKKPSRAKKG